MYLYFKRHLAQVISKKVLPTNFTFPGGRSINILCDKSNSFSFKN